VLAIILFVIVIPFGLGALLGAPYVPILRRDSERILKISALKPGQTLIDLGSGDGRLLRAAAARGIHCIGYEINPYLVIVSRIVCWRYRKLVRIYTANLWTIKLPPADVIYIFLQDRHMTRLENKFRTEIARPTKVISYVFKLPHTTPTAETPNTFIYEFGSHTATSAKRPT
jgi:hypothetical protein